MDLAACRVIYIDDRFNTERWISREGLTTPTTPQQSAASSSEFSDLPPDLQANVNAFLSVFTRVFVCHSGRSFSTKLSELHEQVQLDCTPIIACFDVGSESRHDHARARPRSFPPFPPVESPLPSPTLLRREITFSSESDESYGLQLLSRIASDLQVEEGVELIIPVAIVQPKRKGSLDGLLERNGKPTVLRAPYGPETVAVQLEDTSDSLDPQIMLQCLDAGALDVVKSPLDKAAIMGLTVHAYRIYKKAEKEQGSFMAQARKGRKQSWVGMEEEKPYAYLREAMVKKLLKGICEPQNVIEDYQHRDLYVQDERKDVVARQVGNWAFDGHNFTEDELVYAGYCMLSHALQMPELENWRMPQSELLHFMQGCRIAYNSFVLYHNFRHAVDVLQAIFYFLVQIGTLPPYPAGAAPSEYAKQPSPIARLLGPFEALTLLISAIGHDVGHPGVNNMFLVKLNAPLAQLYNDQSVLEAFHCAAYSQILRRHWPAVFQDKALRKLMISSILATDMGVHSDYMQQLGHLQEKIHESKVTDGWQPKDIDAFRVLTCGLLIKCADISNVARPWSVAEKWTHLLLKEFAHQGEMERAVGMETTLFGGPPELGNLLKLANGQVGFMTIFAHPLFANVADIIPAMAFAAQEILTNKDVWLMRVEQEKRMPLIRLGTGFTDGGAVSPRTQSPVGHGRKVLSDDGKDRSGHFLPSPLRGNTEPWDDNDSAVEPKPGKGTPRNQSQRSSLVAVAGIVTPNREPPPRRSSAPGVNWNSPRRSSPNRKRSSKAMTNGEHQFTADDPGSAGVSASSENEEPNSPHTSTPSIPTKDTSPESSDSRRDKTRDNTVSMRAGIESLPIPAGKMVSQAGASDALSKFMFATSGKAEPVRTYDPPQHYPPIHTGARASPPSAGLEHEKQKKTELGQDAGQTVTQSETNTTSSTLRGGGGGGGVGEEDMLTRSHSTGVTSYDSEKSDVLTRNHQIDFDAERNRAASAPIQSDSPFLGPTFSIGSNASTSRDSKLDVHATILSNGDVEESSARHRKISKTMGRRRSRLKLGLAFWKRSRSGRAIGDDEGIQD